MRTHKSSWCGLFCCLDVSSRKRKRVWCFSHLSIPENVAKLLRFATGYLLYLGMSASTKQPRFVPSFSHILGQQFIKKKTLLECRQRDLVFHCWFSVLSLWYFACNKSFVGHTKEQNLWFPLDIAGSGAFAGATNDMTVIYCVACRNVTANVQPMNADSNVSTGQGLSNLALITTFERFWAIILAQWHLVTPNFLDITAKQKRILVLRRNNLWTPIDHVKSYEYPPGWLPVLLSHWHFLKADSTVNRLIKYQPWGFLQAMNLSKLSPCSQISVICGVHWAVVMLFTTCSGNFAANVTKCIYTHHMVADRIVAKRSNALNKKLSW